MEFLTDTEQGKRSRSLRESAGVTREVAAAALRVSVEQIDQIEVGERPLYGHEIAELGRLYGRSVSAFLCSSEPSGALLRDAGADDECITGSLGTFQDCMNDYFAVRALERITR